MVSVDRKLGWLLAAVCTNVAESSRPWCGKIRSRGLPVELLRCELAAKLQPNHTVTVQPGNNITEAVEIALTLSNHVIVNLLPGTYDVTATISVRTDSTDTKTKFRRVEFYGAGQGRTILDAHWSVRHFVVPMQGCLHLSDLTVANGNATTKLPKRDNPYDLNVGGGALILGEFAYANITNVAFENCVAHSGPGVMFLGPKNNCHALAEIRGSRFTGNNGTTAGVVEAHQSQTDIDRCSFVRNRCSQSTCASAVWTTFPDTTRNPVPAHVYVLDSVFEQNEVTLPGRCVVMPEPYLPPPLPCCSNLQPWKQSAVRLFKSMERILRSRTVSCRRILQAVGSCSTMLSNSTSGCCLSRTRLSDRTGSCHSTRYNTAIREC